MKMPKIFVLVLAVGITCQEPLAAQVIPDVGETRDVCLQSWMGTFVCAEGGGGGLVVANRAEAQGWETFKMHRIDKDHVTLQCSNGKYLCAEEGGNSILIANREAIGAWEKFGLTVDSSGRVFFTADNGMYVCADSSGIVVANRKDPGPWEGFRAVSPEHANDDETYRVEVNVYKIGIAPLWHTGTVIDGREYYFQTNNRVESTRPKGMALKHHRTMVRFVPGNKERALAILDSVKEKWNGTRYDAASHNCNHFTNDLLSELGTTALDQEYIQASGLAQLLKNVPGGATAQEILVKWPIEDKRLDEAVMEDLRRLVYLPIDTVKEVRRFGGTISDTWKKNVKLGKIKW